MSFSRIEILAAASALLLCAFTNIPRQTAALRTLNKQTGRTSDISVAVGQ